LLKRQEGERHPNSRLRWFSGSGIACSKYFSDFIWEKYDPFGYLRIFSISIL
jgi:hypothetical protein